MVQKHFRTLDIDVLPLLGADNNLPAEWVDRIRRALFKVEMEIADSGYGLKTDGRRSLVAYRRLLDLLGWVRPPVAATLPCAVCMCCVVMRCTRTHLWSRV